jgi:NAD+ synthase
MDVTCDDETLNLKRGWGERTARRLADWIKGQVSEAGAKGVIFGLSGGLDSAVVGALCKMALPGATLALILPCESLPEDIEDGWTVARQFDIDTLEIDLSETFRVLVQTLGHIEAAGHGLLACESQGSGKGDAFTDCAQGKSGSERNPVMLARANIKPRLRMTALYYYANILGYMVVGTDNRSELAVGYFTKYGDGGVDILPLANLVKKEVRALAEYLGVPKKIIGKPPTAGLWRGQTDESEMGITYEDLDRFLIQGAGAPEVKAVIEELGRKSEHKRQLPVKPPLY